jgi:perosamine synthetase
MLERSPLRRIALSAPVIGGGEWANVQDALDSGWISYAGRYVSEFEASLEARLGARHAVAVINGTAALHLALLLSGVGAGDEVVMPALSFVAPANAVRYLGAWPTFVDVDELTWQLDLEQLERFLESCRVTQGRLYNPHTGRRIAALCIVHLLGGMADVEEGLRVAGRFGLPVVEDAAECLGARYKGREIGAPAPDFDEIPRIVATSFNANKIVTSGSGGALFLSDERTARRARHLATTAKTDPIEFVHEQVGFNYRLPNVLAAIGCAQLGQLDERLSARAALAARYRSELEHVAGVAFAPRDRHVRPNDWLVTIRLAPGSRGILQLLRESGIEARPPWRPLPCLDHLADCFTVECAVANRMHREGLSLPSGFDVTDGDAARISALIREGLAGGLQ